MGATYGIGALASKEAVSRGFKLRAFARSADSLEETDLIEPFAADGRSAENVAKALAGVGAVIYALA